MTQRSEAKSAKRSFVSKIENRGWPTYWLLYLHELNFSKTNFQPIKRQNYKTSNTLFPSFPPFRRDNHLFFGLHHRQSHFVTFWRQLRFVLKIRQRFLFFGESEFPDFGIRATIKLRIYNRRFWNHSHFGAIFAHFTRDRISYRSARKNCCSLKRFLNFWLVNLFSKTVWFPSLILRTIKKSAGKRALGSYLLCPCSRSGNCNWL